ncbi:hypothetical protein TNCV_1085051 [Trichonephila clavipes]|nr:hypothetical protein TNCV_1085051 [Trichonephila clavipes]
MGSLLVTASDSRPEGLVQHPMPPNTLRVHTEEVEVGGGDIYRLFGNFSELNCIVTCMVIKTKANDRRTSALLSMNFVGLDLTPSDSRQKRQQHYATYAVQLAKTLSPFKKKYYEIFYPKLTTCCIYTLIALSVPVKVTNLALEPPIV